MEDVMDEVAVLGRSRGATASPPYFGFAPPVRRVTMIMIMIMIEGCNSCASLAGLVLSFTACFILLVIAPLEGLRGEQ